MWLGHRPPACPEAARRRAVSGPPREGGECGWGTARSAASVLAMSPAAQRVVGIVAHGYLIVSMAAGLFVDPAPGPVLANFGVDNLRFLTPVKVDDTIAVSLTVKQVTPRTSADYGEVRWDAVVTNREEQPVATYDVLTMVAKEWPPTA